MPQDNPTPRRKMRPSVERSCQKCGATFRVPQSAVDRGRGKYCSRKCAGTGKAPNRPSDLWDRLDKSGDCWIWTGPKYESGHGTMGYCGRYDGTHRLAWRFARGPIPEGMYVCHHCDNPACCNPDHLFLGTPIESVQNAVRRGRHGYRKLTEEGVKRIRARHESGETQTSIANDLGLSLGAVWHVVHRKTWKHV